jgi:hypothetical protein
MPHRGVLEKDQTKDSGDFLLAANLKKLCQQRCSQTLALKVVANEKSKFGLLGAVSLAQPSYPAKVMLVGDRVLAVGHERHLAVVVDETDPGEAFMCHPRA